MQLTTETAHAILLYARNHLAPYQTVRRIEFFDLPQTISRKIRRVKLRRREERIGRGDEPSGEWRGDPMRDAPIEGGYE